MNFSFLLCYQPIGHEVKSRGSTPITLNSKLNNKERLKNICLDWIKQYLIFYLMRSAVK